MSLIVYHPKYSYIHEDTLCVLKYLIEFLQILKEHGGRRYQNTCCRAKYYNTTWILIGICHPCPMKFKHFDVIHKLQNHMFCFGCSIYLVQQVDSPILDLSIIFYCRITFEDIPLMYFYYIIALCWKLMPSFYKLRWHFHVYFRSGRFPLVIIEAMWNRNHVIYYLSKWVPEVVTFDAPDLTTFWQVVAAETGDRMSWIYSWS